MSLVLIISTAGLLLYDFTLISSPRDGRSSSEEKMQLASLLYTVYSCSGGAYGSEDTAAAAAAAPRAQWIHTVRYCRTSYVYLSRNKRTPYHTTY
jgi:hypothetical protein